MLEGIPRTYPDGATIFAQGDPAADMYVVRSGTVHIVRAKSGMEMTLAVLGEGEIFGEMGLFDPGPRSAAAVTIGETVVEAIDTATFKSYVSDPVVWQMLAKMAERIHLMNEAYEQLAAESDGRAFT
ncbi:MAG: cyclic nucleotide-binding domain-containing protein [Coriobacteriia bacterium]